MNQCSNTQCQENYLPLTVVYSDDIGLAVCSSNNTYWLSSAIIQQKSWNKSNCSVSFNCANQFNSKANGNLYSPAIFDTGQNFSDYTIVINKVGGTTVNNQLVQYGDVISLSLFSNNYVLAAEYKNAYTCNIGGGVPVYQFVWVDPSTLSDITLSQFTITSFNSIPAQTPISYGDSIILQCIGNPQTIYDPCTFANGSCPSKLCTSGLACNYLNYGFTAATDRCAGNSAFTSLIYPYIGPQPTIGMTVYFLQQTDQGWVSSIPCSSLYPCQTTPCPTNICPNGDGLCPSGGPANCILGFDGSVDFSCPQSPAPPNKPTSATRDVFYIIITILIVGALIFGIYLSYKYYTEQKKQPPIVQ